MWAGLQPGIPSAARERCGTSGAEGIGGASRSRPYNSGVHPWRERLTRWFTPLARRLPFSPNEITLAALLFNLAAAVALLAGRRYPAAFLGAVVLVAVGGLLDALDGIVARVQNKATRFGDLLDHVADRISDTALAAAWLATNGVNELLLVLVVVAVMLNGYIGTQIEATFGERNYDAMGRGEFVLALVVLPIVSYVLFSNGWTNVELYGFSIAEWLAALLLLFAILGIVQRFRLAARLERG
jgi:phosphatidylglycerophosphate synthase